MSGVEKYRKGIHQRLQLRTKTKPQPPRKDPKPSDPVTVPDKQETHSHCDRYKPKFVRAKGYNREGLCSFCPPERWLQLKNAAYWYHMTFTHGICAATKAPFDEPLEWRRKAGSPTLCEALCRRCEKWIALGCISTSVRRGWFRHAHEVSFIDVQPVFIKKQPLTPP